MNLTFDYYHNLQETEFYLCNPDGRELFPIVGFDRKLTLRFNDLSQLTFGCYSTTTSNDGTIVNVDAYEYVQTRRLIFATGIGWFVITNVEEIDNGITKTKNVTCDSLQATLKDRGFYCEERVYYFYNPADPTDANYDPEDDVHVPSVMGQLYQQLGIQQDLQQGTSDPSTPYNDWTITYINPDLIGKGRNLKESTDYSYEWIVKSVEEAYEVVVLFDFFYKTIHVMKPSEITAKANVIYTFSNFMKEVEIEESAENIVTVMDCKGDNCDIIGVNPTGTDYICDFSYYMDDAGRWMSSALKAKINAWKAAVEEAKPGYEAKVQQLRAAYASLTPIESTLQEVSKIYEDLSRAVAKKSVALASGDTPPSPSDPGGIVWCETVNVGETSMENTSAVRYQPLNRDMVITVYKDHPSYDSATQTWTFSGNSFTGTIDECIAYKDENENAYLYFSDLLAAQYDEDAERLVLDGSSTVVNNSLKTNATVTNNKMILPRISVSGNSYCKLQGMSRIDPSTYEVEYVCKGFKRYTALVLANVWTQKYDFKKADLQDQKENYETIIETIEAEIKAISDSLNIISFFSDTPLLLKELQHYWIEGEYTNENIVVDEDTTNEQIIDLEHELLESGEVELAKVCQPKIQFSLTSADCLKQYEFRDQMRELELGKIVTVEKEEGVWYYPALLCIELDLDKSDSFSMQFANALKLDDWGFTYGDMMSSAASTSRQVAANWQNITAYSKDKAKISALIKDPLSSTLRASFANMTNQEFTVNENGILGRRFVNENRDSFEDEQVRLINNVMLFTDDNWETARAAFGKITYTDDNDQTVTAYGLIGEAIIGNLLMGETLKIRNENSSIVLDDSGITIKNGNTVVFSADINGNLTVRGTIYSSFGTIGGWSISSSGITKNNAGIYSGTAESKPSLIASGSSPIRFYAGGNGASSRKFAVLEDGSLYAAGVDITGGTVSTASDNTTATLAAGEVKITNTSGGTIFDQKRFTKMYLSGTAVAFRTTNSGLLSSLQCGGNIYWERGIHMPSLADGWGIRASLNTSDVTNFSIGVDNQGYWEEFMPIQDPPTHFGYVGISFNMSGTDSNCNARLIGTWQGTLTDPSDRNLKNSIEPLSDRYERFFDLLKPARFKFNDGTSGRYHTGFIAQEVEEAIEKSGLSTDEAALFVRFSNEDPATGSIETTYGLRYSEFVAINTLEIQKLKRRVAELENIVAQLQNE